MRITSKGQVTVPINIREQLGFFPDTEVYFEIRNNEAILKKADQQSKGKQFIKNLSGKATIKMTTDEILSLTRV